MLRYPHLVRIVKTENNPRVLPQKSVHDFPINTDWLYTYIYIYIYLYTHIYHYLFFSSFLWKRIQKSCNCKVFSKLVLQKSDLAGVPESNTVADVAAAAVFSRQPCSTDRKNVSRDQLKYDVLMSQWSDLSPKRVCEGNWTGIARRGSRVRRRRQR